MTPSKLNVAYSYSWLLPSGTIAQVQDIIKSLRRYAIEMGSGSVSEVVVLIGNDAQAARPDADQVILFTAIIPNTRSDSGTQQFGLAFSPEEKSWSWSGVVRVSSFNEISGLMVYAASLGVFVGTTFAGMMMEYRRNSEGEIEVEQRSAFDPDSF